jgi:hypothetical protein
MQLGRSNPSRKPPAFDVLLSQGPWRDADIRAECFGDRNRFDGALRNHQRGALLAGRDLESGAHQRAIMGPLSVEVRRQHPPGLMPRTIQTRGACNQAPICPTCQIRIATNPVTQHTINVMLAAASGSRKNRTRHP